MHFRPAAPGHGPHRGPGGDQRQGGDGRAHKGLPRPPGQREPEHRHLSAGFKLNSPQTIKIELIFK